MKSRLAAVLLLGATLAAQSVAPEKPRAAAPVRKFRFTYSFVVSDIPANSKVMRVWVPVARTDEHQTVRLVNVKAPVQTRIADESEYGNRILYAEIHNPMQPALFSLEYEVTRREYARGGFAQLESSDVKPGVVPVTMERYVSPDRLIPLTGVIAQLAAQVTTQKPGTVSKAKAAYDYLFQTMHYDKSGTGWGRGDAVWACDAKRGNCTDFHSVFIGMMRADDIPARFNIGFALPEGKDSGELPGYHCWAEFFARNIGWVPVDISEAWLNKDKADYFFGSIDVNRVQLSTGRDINLSPRQDGPALNYFVYPYVEIDGKVHEVQSKHFGFSDLVGNESADSGPAPAPAM